MENSDDIGKKSQAVSSHAITLEIKNDLTESDENVLVQTLTPEVQMQQKGLFHKNWRN